MLKYILLLLLLLPSTGWGWQLVSSQSSGTSYIINETFEGTGTPTGAGLTWSTNAVYQYDYSTVPLANSQSLRKNGAPGGSTNIVQWPTTSGFIFNFLFKCESLSTATASQAFGFRDSSADIFYFGTSGGNVDTDVTKLFLQWAGSSTYTTTDLLDPTKTYEIQIEHTPAADAGSTASLYFRYKEYGEGSWIETIGGTVTGRTGVPDRFQDRNGSSIFIFDNFLLWDAP